MRKVGELRLAAIGLTLFGVPQTISIAVGAALITLIDYRIEVVAMACVFAVASVYLLTRRDDERAAEVEPALA
jgi:hypothetical protein